MLGNFIDFLNDNIYTEIRKEIKYFLSLDYSLKRKNMKEEIAMRKKIIVWSSIICLVVL